MISFSMDVLYCGNTGLALESTSFVFWNLLTVLFSLQEESFRNADIFFESMNDVCYAFRIKMMFDSSLLQYFVGGLICVCLRIVMSNTHCVLCFFVLCTPCCQCLLIVHFWLPLRYSLTFISMLFLNAVSWIFYHAVGWVLW